MSSRQHINWYQTSSALFVVSLIVAAVLVWTSWDWSDILRKETEHFCFNYQVVAKDGYVVTGYEGTEHEDCAGKAVGGGFMVRVELRGYPRLLKRLKDIERTQGWLPLSQVLSDDYQSDASGAREIPVADPMPQILNIDKQFKRLTVVGSDDDVRPQGTSGRRGRGIEPVEVEVIIEKIVSVYLRVDPDTVGEPAEGFLEGAATVAPKEIEVRVPESKKDTYEFVKTVSLDVSNRQENHVFTDVRLQLPEFTKVRGDKEPTVEVTVEILPKRKWVLLEPVKVTLQNSRVPGYIVRSEPEYVAIQVRMDETRDETRLKGVRAIVNAEQQPVEENETRNAEVSLGGLPSWVDLAEDAEDVKFLPREVRLIYEKNADE